MRYLIVGVAAVFMTISSGWAAQPDSPPAGADVCRERFISAYELFMFGDAVAARKGFEALMRMPDGQPDYVADAGLMIGWLDHVERNLDMASQAFERVAAMTNISAACRADAEIGIGRCRFDAGDMPVASNAFKRALSAAAGVRKYDNRNTYQYLANGQETASAFLALIRENKKDMRNMRTLPQRRWSAIEENAREIITRRHLAEAGMSPEHSYLKGQMVAGKYEPYGPYPESGFPYKWDFDDGTLCGINRTNGLSNLKVVAKCLKATTGADARFGWGRFNDGDKQNSLLVGYGSGINDMCPNLAGFKVRLRQSLPESKWLLRMACMSRVYLTQVVDFPAVIVKGTNWQECVFTVPGRRPFYLGFPGIEFVILTPGNEVEIDWVKPLSAPGAVRARKEIVLASKVRWARVSISSLAKFRFFVNGHEAVESPKNVTGEQMWNYDLDPKLFRECKNVLAIEAGRQFLVDGALLCADGSYVRFDSDGSWRSGLAEADAAWTKPDYNDSAWSAVELCHRKCPASSLEDRLGRYWFNPSYKGRIMVEPVDSPHLRQGSGGQGAQPVFGCRENIALRIAVPARKDETPQVKWAIFDEMGDYCQAADRKVKEGTLSLRREAGAAVADLVFRAGELASNVAYAVVLDYSVNGRPLESRRYELAVCGPVVQPVVVNPTNYTDGMELKLVWECDAAAEQPPGAFISCDGRAAHRKSSVIKTPLGRFLQPYAKENLGSFGGEPCNYISFKYHLEHPGRPHVAIAEYPDDTARCQEMRITEGSSIVSGYGNELGNDMVVLGLENPLTHEIRRHHCLFFPGRQIGTVTFFSIGNQRDNWEPGMAARVGKIRIYEVLNDVPVRRMADAPGARKWVGQMSEAGPRQIFQSCFSGPMAGYIRSNLIAGETPNFYRNWMIASINMVKRMKFAGENAYYCGQFMYSRVLYPSEFAETTAFGCSGSLRDYGVLLARMFEENNLGLFSAIEMSASERMTLTGNDNAVADGAPTYGQINREGRQITLTGKLPCPNWIQPEGRAFYEKVVNELVALYSREPGWKGIVLNLYAHFGGPWLWQPYATDDPWFASYDDYTIALFEKETARHIPVEKTDPQRFARRYAWLMDNAKPEWTAWRCQKMGDLYAWTRDQLKAARPDAELIVSPSASSFLLPPFDEQPGQALPSIFDYGRRGGMDMEQIKNDPNMILAMAVSTKGDFNSIYDGDPAEFGKGRWRAHKSSQWAPFANDGKNGLAILTDWYEAQPAGPEGWVWSFTSPESWPYPQDDYFADYWLNGFIRTNPRLIVHSMQDQVLWNGRETSMSRFAQAFRSLPATTYTRLTQDGCDQNVWISLGVYAGKTYGYVANPHWWAVDVTLELAKELKGCELTAGEDLSGGEWRGSLAPYTMRTFRFDGAQPKAIIACQAVVSEKGRQETGRLLAQWNQELEANRLILNKIGRANDFAAVIRSAQNALQAGDYGLAYEGLTSYPARRLWRLLEKQTKSAYILTGWTISKMLIRGQRKLETIDCVSASDAALEWRPLAAANNRVKANGVYGNQDGIVYFANRIRFPIGGDWTICVGHDGGCRVFVDGKSVLCEPRRVNPILEDRSKATINVAEGDHTIIVAFDTDHGLGSGITVRFQAPGGQLCKGIEFPAAVESGR